MSADKSYWAVDPETYAVFEVEPITWLTTPIGPRADNPQGQLGLAKVDGGKELEIFRGFAGACLAARARASIAIRYHEERLRLLRRIATALGEVDVEAESEEDG